MRILQNAIITPDGTILLSSNTRETIKHTDINGKEYAITGGRFYLSRPGAADYTELSITEKHSLEYTIGNLLWLTSGSYKKLITLESSHLESIYQHKTVCLLHKFVIAEILTCRKYWPKRLKK